MVLAVIKVEVRVLKMRGTSTVEIRCRRGSNVTDGSEAVAEITYDVPSAFSRGNNRTDVKQ
jgi:hypothetical protein